MDTSHHSSFLKEIFNAAVAAVHPDKLIPSWIQLRNDTIKIKHVSFPCSQFKNIYVAGAGKAGASMAKAVETILGTHIKEGIVAIKEGHSLPLQYIEIIEAGHPLPDKNSVYAADRISSMFQKAGNNDLIIFLLSGGASAILTDLPKNCSLEDVNTTINALLKCGATIEELNTVRKHLSSLKGGQLVKLAAGATIINLVISDVIGNDLSVIGSGPTVGDDSTFMDAMHVIKKYSLHHKIPAPITNYLEEGIKGIIAETPFSNDIIFQHTSNYIIGDNDVALLAAQNKAEALGYKTRIINQKMKGDVKQAAYEWTELVKSYENEGKYCLIAGGETTVNVQGNGKGGRNQQFALHTAIELQDHHNISVLAAGTDGTDGPTDATGAIVNCMTVKKAESLKLNAELYLKNNDSYNFFERTGGHLKTGPTQTNVMDIVLAIIN